MTSQLPSIGVILLFGQMYAASVAAQPAPNDQIEFRDRVVVESSFALQRQLTSLEQLRDAGRWREAAQLILQLSADSPAAVVETEPHRYLGIGDWLHAELATWPPEGIDAYRDFVDPGAIPRYEDALSRRDMNAMRSILDHDFGSSVYDDACWQLAHWAWEDGDLEAAESYWQRLLPRDDIVSAGAELRLAQFVECDYAPELVLSRLALCRVFLRERDEAKRAVEAYSIRFPTASGSLAGIDGPFAETLHAILDDRDDWVPRFAEPETNRVQRLAWSRPLAPIEVETFSTTGLDIGRASAHALLTSGDSLIVLSPHRVQVLDIATGNARWPTGRSDDDGTAYADPATEDSKPTLRGTGVPLASGIVAHGFVYASVGWPILVHAEDEVRELDSRIVCINIDRGEGLVEWIANDELLPDNWRFCGEPATAGDRLLVPTTTTAGPIMLGLAALSPNDGALEWHRELCGVTDSRPLRSHVFGRNELCISQGDVIWSTPFGCVLRIDGITGRLRWAVTYRSDDVANDVRESTRKPVVSDGVAFVADPSAGQVLAIDVTHGVVRWTAKHLAGVNHVLGERRGILVISGDALWGLNVMSGERLWTCGFGGPEGIQLGSGLWGRNTAWWTTRDALLGTDVDTGTLVSRVEIQAAWGLSGGNLIRSPDHLMMLEPDRLSALQIR